MKNQSFRTFFDVEPLMENVQDAKSYLVKLYAEKNNVKPSEIDEETKKRIFNSPKFLEIKDLLDRNKMPGNTFPFLKFAVDQKANLEQLEDIIELLKDNKNNLNSLPMSMMEYAKVDRTGGGTTPHDEGENDHRPGWEMLRDDLANIERKRKLKNFIDKLTPRMKEYVMKKASSKQLEALEELSYQLKVLPKNDEGREAWDSFFYPDAGVLNAAGKPKGKMGEYDDTHTYKEYANPSVALDAIINGAQEFIDKWGEDEDEIIAKIKAMKSQAGLIYAKNGFLVMSARTPDAQRMICSETGWCIKNDSNFWSYGAGRVQINFINNNVPTSDRNSLVGITVNKNGTVHVEYDRPNGRVAGNWTGKDATELLKHLGLPEEGIKAFEEKFPREARIKVALEQYFRNGASLSAREIIASLLTFNKGFLAGTMDPEEWEDISGVVTDVIADQTNLTSEDFFNYFLGKEKGVVKGGGIFSAAGWNVFDQLVGKDYTKEEIKALYDKTMDLYDSMEGPMGIIEMIENGTYPKATPEQLASLKDAVKFKAENIARFKKLMA